MTSYHITPLRRLKPTPALTHEWRTYAADVAVSACIVAALCYLVSVSLTGLVVGLGGMGVAGAGLAAWMAKKVCPTCYGYGYVEGQMTCPKCKGEKTV